MLYTFLMMWHAHARINKFEEEKELGTFPLDYL
jgi:hypothetical protein